MPDEYRGSCTECGRVIVDLEEKEICHRCEEEEDEEDGRSTFDIRHGRKHRELREQLMDERGRECEECGITNEEHIRRDDLFPPDGGLHLHHIEPTENFDNPDDAHFPENGLILCDTCHRKHDQYLRNLGV